MNMVKISTALLPARSPAVMPVESPAVLYADTCSNSRRRKSVSGSKIQSAKVPQLTTIRPIKVMVAAFASEPSGRRR